MPMRIVFAAIFMLAVCRSAFADEKYTIHENLHVGQTTSVAIVNDYKVKSTSTTAGTSTATDTRNYQSWKVKLTVLEVKNGSSLRTQVDVSPDSFDLDRNGETEKKAACPYAGKTVIVSRLADETFANNFQGDASEDDVNMLDGFVCPDQDFFPEKPVAVGDVWDVSEKVAKHAELDPKDQLICKCRLDWVKTIDSKQMAQISCSQANIYHQDDNVEEDVQINSTLLVDVAAGMIVKFDQTGSSKYVSPPAEKTQVTGGTEFSCHCEVVPKGATAAVAKP
jgi:hypothetical protein